MLPRFIVIVVAGVSWDESENIGNFTGGYSMLVKFSSVWPSPVAFDDGVAVSNTEVLIDLGLLDDVVVVQLENQERPATVGFSDGDVGGLPEI